MKKLMAAIVIAITAVTVSGCFPVFIPGHGHGHGHHHGHHRGH